MSVDIVLFSDHHAHNFNTYAEQTVSTVYPGAVLNSRFEYSLRVLQEVQDYCQAHSVKYALFGGDLFHVRKAVPTDVSFYTLKKMDEMARNLSLLVLTGNHDFYDKYGNTTLASLLAEFHSPVTFAGSSGHYPIVAPELAAGHFHVFAVPYCPTLAETRSRLDAMAKLAADPALKGPKLLLAHLGIQGAKVGSDYVLELESDIKPDDIPQGFDACFFGHYHQHQEIAPKSWYIGATHQHNWGDANTQRGFLHVTLQDNGDVSLKFVETKTAPRFIQCEDSDAATLARVRPFDFLKVTTSRDRETVLQEVGAAVPTKDVVVLQAPKDPVDLKLQPAQLAPDGLLNAWLAKHASERSEEERARLLSVGKSLLARAKQEEL